jgi:hypothetical protein
MTGIGGIVLWPPGKRELNFPLLTMSLPPKQLSFPQVRGDTGFARSSAVTAK